MATRDTMRAVVFHGPYTVAVEDRPLPTIQDPLDIIVKVKYAALCGRQGYQIIGLLRLHKLLTRDVQPVSSTCFAATSLAKLVSSWDTSLQVQW
jgi:hypothetical protein